MKKKLTAAAAVMLFIAVCNLLQEVPTVTNTAAAVLFAALSGAFIILAEKEEQKRS